MCFGHWRAQAGGRADSEQQREQGALALPRFQADRDVERLGQAIDDGQPEAQPLVLFARRVADLVELGKDRRLVLLGDADAVEALPRAAAEAMGGVDILVNNAGVCRLGNFLDMSDEDRDFHIDINIKGVWNVTKAVLPEMIARKDGRIVMMSSVTGDMVADPGETAYALSKAAIIGLTKSLAVEYAQSGIRVNAICPGYVRTPMAENIARQSNPEDPESVLVEMAKAIPMRRLACPLEVGELAAFLASDESSYLTGTQNVIDGGSTLPESVSVGV